MKLINKFKGRLFSSKKADNIKIISSKIGKEVVFPQQYFCVVSKKKNEQSERDPSKKMNLLMKSATLNELTQETTRKKIILFFPFYQNLKTESHLNSLKHKIQKWKNSNDVEDFFIISYFYQQDVSLFYHKISPIMPTCNFTFLINEFDSQSFINYFKGKEAVLLLSSDNKLIYCSYQNHFKQVIYLIFWVLLIYFNFVYLPEIENFIKI